MTRGGVRWKQSRCNGRTGQECGRDKCKEEESGSGIEIEIREKVEEEPGDNTAEKGKAGLQSRKLCTRSKINEKNKGKREKGRLMVKVEEGNRAGWRQRI